MPRARQRLSEDESDGYLKLDPTVANLINQGARRQATAQLPRSLRKAKVKERQHNEERRGSRACYDLPPEIIDYIKGLADKHKTTASQIAALGLALFIELNERNPKILEGYLELMPDSPRYEHKVVLPKGKGEK